MHRGARNCMKVPETPVGICRRVTFLSRDQPYIQPVSRKMPLQLTIFQKQISFLDTWFYLQRFKDILQRREQTLTKPGNQAGCTFLLSYVHIVLNWIQK